MNARKSAQPHEHHDHPAATTNAVHAAPSASARVSSARVSASQAELETPIEDPPVSDPSWLPVDNEFAPPALCVAPVLCVGPTVEIRGGICTQKDQPQAPPPSAPPPPPTADDEVDASEEADENKEVRARGAVAK